MSNDKADLRAAMREAALRRRDSPALSRKIAAQLHNWHRWMDARTIAGFSALPGEPDPLDPWPLGKRIALPRVQGTDLTFHPVTHREELVTGDFGILEPPETSPCAGRNFDIILVPGLAFDFAGGRLGRGKGFYDRFLANARGLRVGVCFEDQIVDPVPKESHDARMDFVITSTAIFPCGS